MNEQTTSSFDSRRDTLRLKPCRWITKSKRKHSKRDANYNQAEGEEKEIENQRSKNETKLKELLPLVPQPLPHDKPTLISTQPPPDPRSISLLPLLPVVQNSHISLPFQRQHRPPNDHHSWRPLIPNPLQRRCDTRERRSDHSLICGGSSFDDGDGRPGWVGCSKTRSDVVGDSGGGGCGDGNEG